MKQVRNQIWQELYKCKTVIRPYKKVRNQLNGRIKIYFRLQVEQQVENQVGRQINIHL